MTRKVLFACAAFAAFGTLLGTGCNKTKSGNGSTAASGEKIKIGFMVKQPEEPWFQNEVKFAQQAADKDGFELIAIPGTSGQNVLIGIDNLGSKGVKGLVICAPDVTMGTAILKNAAKFNMKVFAVDDQLLGADGKPLDIPYMGISAYDIGKMVGKTLADEMKKRGWTAADTAACAMTVPELETARKRIQGAEDSLKEAGFPMDRVFDKPNKTSDTSGSFAAANIVLGQHSDVKHWLVFSSNDEGVMGAVRAMENRGFTANDVVGVGIGGSTAKADFDKPKPTGLYASVLIRPRLHGYNTSDLMYQWIKNGKEPPKVTLTNGTLITRDNYKKVMAAEGLL
ncbi:MAG TPA: arabinose ABC transporter substrate-binding protein [Armatimonadota bacterium]|jgi:L-arabinose transport system substrate-binding protein